MVQLLFIGLAAGAASALLVAAITGGTLLAVPLFYLAPLPVMIAGLAFSHLSALLAVTIATVGLGLVFGVPFLVAYLVGIGAPAWGLAYLALLARPEPAGRDGMAWFPIGTLVLAAGGFGVVAVAVALFSIAGDYATYRTFVIAAFDALVRAQGPGGLGAPAPGEDSAALGHLVAHILPATAGVTTMGAQLACLYVAARAALYSGRLVRPWPDLAALRLPGAAAPALAALLAASLLPGMVGLLASVAVAVLVAAYALAGFAVAHFVTRGLGLRTLVLSLIWVASLALGWPVLLMALLGVADALFGVRARVAAAARPPAANDR